MFYLVFVLNGESHLSKNPFSFCPHPDWGELPPHSTAILLLMHLLFHIQFPIMHWINTAAWHDEKPSLKTTAHTHPSLPWTPIILIVCTTQLALYYILSCSLIVCTTQFSTLLHSVRFCNCVMYFCLVSPPQLQAPGWQGPRLVLLWHSHSTKHCARNNKVGLWLTLAGLLAGGWAGWCVGWKTGWLIFWWALRRLSYLEPGGRNR